MGVYFCLCGPFGLETGQFTDLASNFVILALKYAFSPFNPDCKTVFVYVFARMEGIIEANSKR